jgi:hypothetical protein
MGVSLFKVAAESLDQNSIDAASAQESGMSAYSGLFLTYAWSARMFPDTNLRNFASSQTGRTNKNARRRSKGAHSGQSSC